MANISIRMEDKLKQQIPFEITRETLNRETLAAWREVEKMKRNPSLGKSFDDVDTMMEDLLKWNIQLNQPPNSKKI